MHKYCYVELFPILIFLINLEEGMHWRSTIVRRLEQYNQKYNCMRNVYSKHINHKRDIIIERVMRVGNKGKKQLYMQAFDGSSECSAELILDGCVGIATSTECFS